MAGMQANRGLPYRLQAELLLQYRDELYCTQGT